MSSGNQAKRARVALGQSNLAWPDQPLQAPTPAGLVVGGQRRRGGRRVKKSWIKADFERKETEQDGKRTEYSYQHIQRTPTGLNATQLQNHLFNTGICISSCTAPLRKSWKSRWLRRCQWQEVAVWLEIVRDAAEDDAEPDAKGVAAVHMDVEQMDVDEEEDEQGDKQWEGDKEGARVRCGNGKS